MKKLFLIAFLICGLQSISQNWNVFNYNYRYNYIFDISPVVTNVLFVDSSKIDGPDTVYFMNPIVVECSGICPGFTAAIPASSPVFYNNMPQFLQKKIRKRANGSIVLLDTLTLNLEPHCATGQSWAFDNNNSSITAQCISKISQINFGIPDSVKLILISTGDTIKLSKNFGILQFPALYHNHKYYHLAGIENVNTYEANALFGLKVPNAWDFYNYEIGDKFCDAYHYNYKISPVYYTHCYSRDFTITGKTASTTGYTYTISDHIQSSCDSGLVAYTDLVYPATLLSSPTNENTMYPGQLVRTSFYYPLGNSPGIMAPNLVRFGLDNKNTFYKYAGQPCATFTNLSSPADNDTYLSLDPNGGTISYPFPNTGGPIIATTEIYAVGLGCLSKIYNNDYSQSRRSLCRTCALKQAQLYLGTETFVGILEQEKAQMNISIFPNPSDGSFSMNTKGIDFSQLTVTDIFGKSIISKQEPGKDETIELHLDTAPAGIYFVRLLNKQTVVATQKIIKN